MRLTSTGCRLSREPPSLAPSRNPRRLADAARFDVCLGQSQARVLATAIHYTSLSRTGRIDLPLAFTVAASLASFYAAFAARRPRSSLCLAYVAVALGVLLKGPIAAILPAAVLGTWLVLEASSLP